MSREKIHTSERVHIICFWLFNAKYDQFMIVEYHQLKVNHFHSIVSFHHCCLVLLSIFEKIMMDDVLILLDHSK
jgi:hypothetical protein